MLAFILELFKPAVVTVGTVDRLLVQCRHVLRCYVQLYFYFDHLCI